MLDSLISYNDEYASYSYCWGMTPVASLPEQHETDGHRWKLLSFAQHRILLSYHLSVATLIHPMIHLVPKPSHNDMTYIVAIGVLVIHLESPLLGNHYPNELSSKDYSALFGHHPITIKPILDHGCYRALVFGLLIPDTQMPYSTDNKFY